MTSEIYFKEKKKFRDQCRKYVESVKKPLPILKRDATPLEVIQNGWNTADNADDERMEGRFVATYPDKKVHLIIDRRSFSERLQDSKINPQNYIR